MTADEILARLSTLTIGASDLVVVQGAGDDELAVAKVAQHLRLIFQSQGRTDPVVVINPGMSVGTLTPDQLAEYLRRGATHGLGGGQERERALRILETTRRKYETDGGAVGAVVADVIGRMYYLIQNGLEAPPRG